MLLRKSGIYGYHVDMNGFGYLKFVKEITVNIFTNIYKTNPFLKYLYA